MAFIPEDQEEDYTGTGGGFFAEPEKVIQPKKGVVQSVLDAGTAASSFIGAKGLTDLMGSQLAKLGLAARGDMKAANLVEQPSFRDVAGSAIQTAATFMPVGRVARGLTTGANLLGVKMGASTLGKVGTGVAAGYGFDVGSKLQNKDMGLAESFVPGWGTTIGAALPLSTALVGALGKQVLAKTTGAGTEVLNRALRNPDAVNTAINTYATTPEAKQSLVDKARGALNDFLHQRSAEYGADLAKLPVIKTGKKDVLLSFTDEVSNFGGSIKGGQVVFKDTTLTKTDQNNLKQVFSVINGWKDTSAKGLDGLRQAIGNHMDEFSSIGNSRANVVLGNVKKALTSSLSLQTPGYADMLSSYGTKTQTARALMKELLPSPNTKPSTQLNAVMRLFKKDPTVRDNLVKIMGREKADQFMDDLAGAILADWFPPGVVGNAARAILESGAVAATAVGSGALPAAGVATAGLAASSPRIVGKGAVLTGKAIKSGIGPQLTKVGAMSAANGN